MIRLGGGFLLLLIMVLSVDAVAGEVMLCRSNGDLKVDGKKGRYHAMNILDDDKSTAWCSEGTGQGASIEILFSERVPIDKISVLTGNQSGTDTFEAFNRVREVEVWEGDMMHTVQLEDKTGAQPLRFDPSLSTDHLVLKMKAGFRGKSERHTCITDIVFYKGSSALNGKQLKPHIQKSLRTESYLDVWVAGPSYARDRELVLGMAGKYRFVQVPNDPQEQPVRWTDDWRLQEGRLELKHQDKWLSVKLKKDDAGRPRRLKIEQEGKMQGSYVRRKKQPD